MAKPGPDGRPEARPTLTGSGDCLWLDGTRPQDPGQPIDTTASAAALLLVSSRDDLTRRVLRELGERGHHLRHRPDGLSALLALGEQPWPDAILLASDLADVNGIDVCRSLRHFGYRGHLLLLLDDRTRDRVAGLDAGADDVIDQTAGTDELAARLRALRRRQIGMDRLMPPPWMATMAPPAISWGQPLPSKEAENPLTPREQEVVEQMVLGLGNSEIAERLFLSLETVKTHVRNLMGKMKARHRTQAVVLALQSGYCLLPTGSGSMPPNRVVCP